MGSVDPTSDILNECQEALTELIALYGTAINLQWSTPPSNVERVDKSEDGKSTTHKHTDPTGDAATNQERLHLREAIERLEEESPKLRRALMVMRYRTKQAVTPFYEGVNHDS